MRRSWSTRREKKLAREFPCGPTQHAREGTNTDLAKFCGKDPSKVSQRFRKNKPRIIAQADLTLAALRWVCSIRKCDLIVPDWAALRFYYHLLVKNRSRLRAAIRAKLRLSNVEMTQYFIDETTGGSRAPKGGRALEMLAQKAKPVVRREPVDSPIIWQRS
jgi:hypothetical protein